MPSTLFSFTNIVQFGIFHFVKADYEIKNHPVISPSFDWTPLTADLVKTLPNHTYHTNAWTAGYLPEYCYKEAQRNSQNYEDFKVVNVTYDDCSANWVFCIHKDTKDSEDQMFQAFGQVPVGMRSYLANMIAMSTIPASPGAAAITNRYYSVINDGYWNPGTLGHEFSHAMDWQIMNLSDYWSNNSTTWQNAEKSDQALPTQYSATNWIENFAEIGRLSLTNKNVAGGLSAVNSNAGEIYNQVNTYEKYFSSYIYPDGGRCKTKVPSSYPVDISTNTRVRQMRGRIAPDVSLPDDVEALPLPEVWVDDIIEHDHKH